MAEKKYYWLKLQSDFFGSKRIKKLRRLAGGDTYTIIYLKMQLLSLKTDGILKYTGIENSFAEELALDLDEDVENVAVVLQYLESVNLIETSDGVEYLLPYAVDNMGKKSDSADRVARFRERQSIEDKELIRQKDAERKRIARAKQKDESVTDDYVRNVSVTVRNTEIEIEKEIEEDIEREDKVLSDDNTCQGEPRQEDGDIPLKTKIQLVVDEWNKLNIANIRVMSANSNRYKLLVARLQQYGVDSVIEAVRRIAKSKFLMYGSDKWRMDFEWFVKPNNFIKVFEGKYDDNDTGITSSDKGSVYMDAIKNRVKGVDEWV